MWWFRSSPSSFPRHMLVTGGSKGIGLEISRELYRRGARVTLVARTASDLEAAKRSLHSGDDVISGGSPGEVGSAVADTQSLPQLQAAVARCEREFGPVDVVVCNAGFSHPGRFEDLDESNFQRHVDVNYMGTVRTIKAVLPGMLQRRRGHIVIVASALAVSGFAGYSSYAPSKWALRGLADCLRNELQGTGVAVSVGYPPDTKTPGYEEEERYKPEICRAVNAALGSELFDPQVVAAHMVDDIVAKRYHLRGPDVGQNLLVEATAGLTPAALPALLSALVSIFRFVIDATLAGLRLRADRAAKAANARE